MTIIDHQMPDRELAWRFDELFRIGSSVDGPAAFYRIDDRSIGVGRTGHVYVLDLGNKHVLVFDRDGRSVGRFGTEGEGPGELKFPVSLWIGRGENEDEIRVLDFARGRVLRFRPAGGFIGELEVDVHGLGLTRDALWTDRGWVFGASEGYRGDTRDSVYDYLAVTEGSDTLRLTTLGRKAPKRVFFEQCRFRIALAPLYRQTLVWDAEGGRIALNRQKEYVIDVFTGAQKLWSVRRGIPPWPITRDAAVAAAELVWEQPGRRCRIDGEEVLEHRGYDDRLQIVEQLEISPTGELWVRRSDPTSGEGPIDVFDVDGGYLGTLAPETPFPVTFTPDGHPVVIERDELEVPYVVGYRVRRETGDGAG